MIENTNFNYGILKSWNSFKSLADFSPNRRHLKNYRLEREETKIRRSSLNLCEIASAVNRRLAKKRVQCLYEALCFATSSALADSLVLRNPLLRQAANL